MKPAKQVSGMWLLGISMVSIVVSVVFIGFAFKVLSPVDQGTLFGTLFVNEGGYANATSTAVASYNATLVVQGGTGTVLLTFLSGTDLVQNHLLNITDYSINTNQVSMVVGGTQVVLPWEDNDTIWGGQFNNNYIASWGPTAPSAELRGQVNPAIFGLPKQDYVEFRFMAQGGEPSDDDF